MQTTVSLLIFAYILSLTYAVYLTLATIVAFCIRTFQTTQEIQNQVRANNELLLSLTELLEEDEPDA